MKNSDSSIQGVAIVLQDVTRFQFIDSLKTNLVSTVSHELKTPLTSVRMALHVLMERKIGPLNDEQTELLDTARDDAERLLRTINNLLDMTRFEEGRQGLQVEAARPEDLVSAAAEDFASAAAAGKVQVNMEIEPNLPAVSVDRQRIVHVFRNLLNNALKFSKAGGIITIRARRRVRDPEIVRFSVIDQGPGVQTEYQAKVFQKFFRVPGQQKTGAGLGLSIARQIVEAHEGRIGVLSTPGSGSEFFFDLPLAR
jgi:signal transduction histidine kinase